MTQPTNPKAAAFLDALERLCRDHAVSLWVASYEPVYIEDLDPDEAPLNRDDWRALADVSPPLSYFLNRAIPPEDL